MSCKCLTLCCLHIVPAHWGKDHSKSWPPYFSYPKLHTRYVGTKKQPSRMSSLEYLARFYYLTTPPPCTLSPCHYLQMNLKEALWNQRWHLNYRNMHPTRITRPVLHTRRSQVGRNFPFHNLHRAIILESKSRSQEGMTDWPQICQGVVLRIQIHWRTGLKARYQGSSPWWDSVVLFMGKIKYISSKYLGGSVAWTCMESF